VRIVAEAKSAAHQLAQQIGQEAALVCIFRQKKPEQGLTGLKMATDRDEFEVK